ncbi:transmembrane protein 161B-like [Clavelina lepadiformis]|uniref:transmembrane protein 161B-like n=1 Tax=Clavelina lepadiformis TaxID=159417 RepID=UPI0040422C19
MHFYIGAHETIEANIMAVFGFQLCFTLIMASFMQKLTPIYSFGRWLMCNGSLVRYKHPTDEELKKLAGKPSDKSNNKARNRRHNYSDQKNSTTFKVSKKLEITLDAQPVYVIDTIILRNYTDYEWLVNYTLFSIFVYIGTEIYYESWHPTKEFNISMVWILLSMWFAVKNLCSVLVLYAKAKAGGEISMSITYGMFSFIVALGTLMIKEDVLEFGIEAYINDNITSTNSTVPEKRHFSISGIKLLLATCSSFLGILFAFPALRMAQMYVDALRYSKGNAFTQFLLHLNFFAPAAIALMWIKPIVRDLIRDPRIGLGRSEDVSPMLTDSQFEIMRILFIICICFLRLALLRIHLQAYLNIAYEKMMKLRKESGMITNIELQKIITRVFYYLGVVAVQYLSPLVLVLCSVMCLKTMGGYSWLAFSADYKDNVMNLTTAIVQNNEASSNQLLSDSTLQDMVHTVGGNLYSIRAIFTPVLLRGVFSYIVWWSSFNWTVASSLGLLYHSYLID